MVFQSYEELLVIYLSLRSDLFAYCPSESLI